MQDLWGGVALPNLWPKCRGTINLLFMLRKDLGIVAICCLFIELNQDGVAQRVGSDVCPGALNQVLAF